MDRPRRRSLKNRLRRRYCINNKIMKRLYSAALVMLGMVSLASCDATFHDDLSDCPHTLLVTLGDGACTPKKTVSEANIGIGADGGNSSFAVPAGKLHLLAFDQKGILAANTSMDLAQAQAVKAVPLQVKGAGNYRVLAWAGVDAAQWDVANLTNGTTRINDIFLTQKAAAANATAANESSSAQNGTATNGAHWLSDLAGQQVWMGANANFVAFPEAEKEGGHTRTAVVNIAPQLFQVTAEIEVDPTTFDGKNDLLADSFDIEVTTHHAALHADGTPQVETTTHRVALQRTSTKTTLRTAFAIPALSARDAKVTLTLVNRHGTESRVVEQGTFDLLGLLQLQQDFDPQCERAAHLRFLLRDRCLECGEFACYAVVANGLPITKFSEGK